MIIKKSVKIRIPLNIPEMLLRALFAFFIQTILFHKLLNTSGRINELLFACEKWMTIRTYFQSHITFGRTNLKFVPASAFNGPNFIFGMNFFFQKNQPPKTIIEIKIPNFIILLISSMLTKLINIIIFYNECKKKIYFMSSSIPEIFYLILCDAFVPE